MTGQNAWIRATALVMVAGPLAWPLGCSTAYDNESAREGQSATEEAPSEALEESNSRSEGAGRTEGAEDVAESESLIDASDSRSPSETAVSDLTVPAESNPSEGPAAVATSVPEEESVDLLKLVDPTGDAHGGSCVAGRGEPGFSDRVALVVGDPVPDACRVSLERRGGANFGKLRIESLPARRRAPGHGRPGRVWQPGEWLGPGERSQRGP